MRRQDLAEISFLTAAWCAAVAIVDPRGDFPLHDDWIYTVATWRFAETGHFHFPAFTTTSLRAQVLWGALWTRLFGQSFNVLRASTLLLSLATLLVLHRILARAGAPRAARILAPLALLVHPVFLWASCTYMSDVPYVFAAVVAFYFFARGLEEERIGLIVAGCAAVAVSWFVRQNGVVNLLPPLAVLAMTRPKRWRAVAISIAPFLAFFVLLFFFKRDWLSGSPALFAVHYHMWLESSFRLPEQVSVLFHYIAFNAVNCAVFFLPLTAALVAFRRRSRPALLLLGAIALILGLRTAYLAWNGYWIPYTSHRLFSDILPGQIFIDFAVGPANLTDTWDGFGYPFRMPFVARVVLTIAVAALATLLVWALAVARGGVALRLAVASIVFGTLVLFASGFYYDRYALDSAWAVAIALPLIIPWEKRLARGFAIAGLIALGLFTTLAVREHFAWNRARWTAYRDLRAKGIAVDQIDGGGEIHGLIELPDAPLSAIRTGMKPRRYVLAFNPLAGHRVIARYPFTGFLGMHRADVLVLERQ